MEWKQALPTIIKFLNSKYADRNKKEIEMKIKTEKEPNGPSGKELIESIDKFLLNIKKKKPIDTITEGVSRAQDDSSKLLNIGDTVRVKLEAPIDNLTGHPLQGKFRASDARWNLKPTKIDRIILNPNQPPMYLTKKNPNSAYTKNELQLVKPNEVFDVSVVNAPANEYTFYNILDKRKVGRSVEFLVKFTNSKKPIWLKKNLIDGSKAGKKLIKAYEKEN
jgi:hypothetical protein